MVFPCWEFHFYSIVLSWIGRPKLFTKEEKALLNKIKPDLSVATSVSILTLSENKNFHAFLHSLSSRISCWCWIAIHNEDSCFFLMNCYLNFSVATHSFLPPLYLHPFFTYKWHIFIDNVSATHYKIWFTTWKIGFSIHSLNLELIFMFGTKKHCCLWWIISICISSMANTCYL